MTRAAAREAIRQYYWGGPYLLDTYTNAAFAYSFRRLRKTYYGPVVRIRESGANAEKDFGTNSTGDFDAAGAAAFIGANTGYIVTWYDQSGNGLDMTQGTAGTQPTYSASTFLSGPSALFGAKYLSRSIAASAFSPGTNFTSILVLQQDNTEPQIPYCWEPGQVTRPIKVNSTTAQFDFGNSTDSTGEGRVTFTVSSWVSTPLIWVSYRDASDNQGIEINGSSLGTASRSADITTGTANFILGANSDGNMGLFGYMTELIIWGTDLGGTNRAAARTAINTYYSVY